MEKILQITELSAADFLKEIESLKLEIGDLKRSQKQTDKYLTREETADFFKVSTTTIWHWSKKGILKPYKIANKVYYKLSDLENALTEM